MSLNNTLNSREFEEKRDFIRMRVDSPIEVFLKNEKQPLCGICRDLSGGGMLVELEVPPLAVGTRVEVMLSSNHGHAPMLRAHATVCRVSDASGCSSSMGLRLRNILL